MALHARILSDASFKENVSPRKKRSSEEAFSSQFSENVSKRRTIDSLLHNQAKVKSLFPKSSSKKQPSIKNYYGSGLRLKSNKNVKIYNDNGEKKIQKQKEKKRSEGFDLMCAEEASEKYWELLAEERRKALGIALEENKELAEEIREKDQIIFNLTTEVSELKETAKHAEYLATVLEELGKDCNVPDTEEDSEEEKDVFQEDLSSSEEEEKTKESVNEESPDHEESSNELVKEQSDTPGNQKDTVDSETVDLLQDSSDPEEEEFGSSDADYSVNATCNTTAGNLTSLQTFEEESD